MSNKKTVTNEGQQVSKAKSADVPSAKELPSGRWILTITAAAIMLIFGLLSAIGLCVMLSENKLESSVILAIFSQLTAYGMLIANWYFQRTDRKNGNG